MQVVKIACELPSERARSLSQWDCTEIAHQLIRDEVVPTMSAETVRRILTSHHLKPWRHRMWLSPKTPRDARFVAMVHDLITLYTRPLSEGEAVLSLDENTNLQPRPRTAPTRPALPEYPVLLEHEYRRAGAINLLAAFDTRSGKVIGITERKKRQAEFLLLLEAIDAAYPASFATIHLVMDNLRMHTGRQVLAWLAAHPRFVCHFTPVHCSWLNQIEQWFSILQRKRLRIVHFASLAALCSALHVFLAQWNEQAHPFNWTSQSATKFMAKCRFTLAA